MFIPMAYRLNVTKLLNGTCLNDSNHKDISTTTDRVWNTKRFSLTCHACNVTFSTIGENSTCINMVDHN